jgi:hypothetical protein
MEILMPFMHTNSKTTGDLFNDGPYTHAKIVQYLVDLKSSGVWLESKTGGAGSKAWAMLR